MPAPNGNGSTCLPAAPRDRHVLAAHRRRKAFRPRPRPAPSSSTARSARSLQEEQIYRIDHYLGKETVQNILVFRFANGIWEPIWSRRYVDSVQITVAESLGVEDRASYYDTCGALRDMLQNHMMQLLTLVAMEPPTAFDAQAVRDEKAKVLRAIKPFTPAEVAHNTIRGQYGPGAIFGKPVPGYRQEPGVPPNSETETYVAARFFVDNWRWSGVPFYLRHGKRLPKRDTEIAIQFKPAPLALFQTHLGRRAAAQRAGAPYPARRRHLDQVRVQAARPGNPAPLGGDELQLRRLIRRGGRGRLRAPPLGRDDRRLDPLHPPRRGRIDVEPRHLHPGRLASASLPPPSPTTEPVAGVQPWPTTLSPAMGERGGVCNGNIINTPGNPNPNDPDASRYSRQSDPDDLPP